MLRTFTKFLYDSKRSTMPGIINLGRKKSMSQYKVKMNPVGASNIKTQVPGTIRPVGPSCPPCQYEDTCYALFGHSGMHQKRASHENHLPSTLAAATAMVAAVKNDCIARLHVSGDFYKNGSLDVDYIYSLVEVGSIVQELSGKDKVAWSYTHVPIEEFEPYRILLKSAGITVLYSDFEGVGGAVVWEFDKIDELRDRNKDVLFAKCPAQLSKHVSCKSCKACWSPREKKICIVFDPHGSGSKKIRHRKANHQEAIQ